MSPLKGIVLETKSMKGSGPLRRALAAALIVVPLASARAEVIEEIVARVNDDIITRSELQVSEQEVMEEILAKGDLGEAVEKHLSRAKTEILRDLITRKILIQQAERLYDLTKMQDAFVRQFKDQQKITTNSELESILRGEGMTLDEFKRKLIEINAPNSVVDLEVRNKVSVSDAEIETYYQEHQAEMSSPDTVAFREIVLMGGAGPAKDEVMVRARSLASQAREGGDFADMARENSQVDPAGRGTLLGPFKKGELAPEIETLVFSMKPGEVSEPVEVAGAVHIVRVEGREASATPSLESMKKKIGDLLEREKFGTLLHDYIQGLWRQSKICVADEYVPNLSPEYRKYVQC